MKIVPIKRKSSISAIALPSLMHKSCVICSDNDFVPIRTLEEAYDHAWHHWDAWQLKIRGGATQMTLFELDEEDSMKEDTKDEWISGDKMVEMANELLDWQPNKQDEVMEERVCFLIHQKFINMLDELSELEAEGNRTQMFITLIEKQYRIKKDLQQWQSDNEIRRGIRDSFKKE